MQSGTDFTRHSFPYAQEVLNVQLNPHFIAKIDEHLFIHELPADTRGKLAGCADVGVAEITAHAGASSTAVLEAPAEVRLPSVDVERVSYLEIRDREDWRLVTVPSGRSSLCHLSSKTISELLPRTAKQAALVRGIVAWNTE